MAELFAIFQAYDVRVEWEREEEIKKLVKSAKELGANKEQEIQRLMKQYELSDSGGQQRKPRRIGTGRCYMYKRRNESRR